MNNQYLLIQIEHLKEAWRRGKPDYIFYLPDEEFPAAVTCLFAANAMNYLSVDGLADVAEYTG